VTRGALFAAVEPDRSVQAFRQAYVSIPWDCSVTRDGSTARSRPGISKGHGWGRTGILGNE
jgi:hypothetical protein